MIVNPELFNRNEMSSSTSKVDNDELNLHYCMGKWII